MSKTADAVDALLGQNVVLDAVSLYAIVGRLAGRDERYFILEDADVHDLRDTPTTRERYVLDSRLHGIRISRRHLLVRRDEIVSISALDDVVE